MSFFPEITIQGEGPDETLWVDVFHAARANPVVRLAGTSFVGNTKDTNFWTEATAVTGAVSQAAGAITLTTGATAASSTAQYQSARLARWVPGAENTFRAILKCGDTGTANNVRNWGAFTATDGVFFQLSGTTLNIVTRNNSVDTPIASSSWNVNNTFVMDTNFHCWEILMSYYRIHIFVDGVLVHRFVNTASLYTQTFNLPATLQNNNSGSATTANVTMTAGVAFISRSGQLQTECIYKNIHGANAGVVLKYGAGRLLRIVENTSAGTTATIYDGTSAGGVLIATITLSAETSLEYDCPFNTGLFIVTTGSTTDITVVYE